MYCYLATIHQLHKRQYSEAKDIKLHLIGCSLKLPTSVFIIATLYNTIAAV